MGVRATCPHCGGRTSNVRMNLRCLCGWADPAVHEPYRRRIELDLSPEQAIEAVRTIEGTGVVLDMIREQLKAPLVSMHDGEPVLFSEPYVWQPGDFDIDGPEDAAREMVRRGQ